MSSNPVLFGIFWKFVDFAKPLSPNVVVLSLNVHYFIANKPFIMH